MGRNLTHNDFTSSRELAPVARFFSNSVMRELATLGRSPLLGRLFVQSGLAGDVQPESQLSALFDAAFNLLRRGRYRDEYTYQDAVTRQILLKRHSLLNATMLPEFRVGACKADLVILNGTSTAYEIKSDRDRLDRLDSQLAQYQKVFARVNVVAGPNHIDALMVKAPPAVGILMLNSRGILQVVREPIDNSHDLCSESLFECLRISEALRVMRILGEVVPSVPNTQLHGVLRSLS